MSIQSAAASGATPMMQQYLDIKDQYQDCLLLYRLGDFYELFFDDAVKAAHILGIVLTKRGESVPMCGIPFHAAEGYIKKLLEEGHHVAVCEQMESPKPGQKGPVRREVVRVLTPGTLTENLDDEASYLIVFSPALKESLGIAICDLSTGFLRTEVTDVNSIEHILARYKPKEIIAPESLSSSFGKRIHLMPDSRFNEKNCHEYLKKHFSTTTLESFGNFSKVEIQAAGFLIDYLLITQKKVVEHITKIQQYESSHYMFMSAATRQSLELRETVSGRYEGSLVHTLNATKTAPGKRMLIERINNPLMNVSAINKRLDQIQFFVERPTLLQNVREELKHFPDLERCLTRLSLKRGGPKDMKAIEIGISKAHTIFQNIKKEFPSFLKELFQLLSQALQDDVPVHTQDGNFIKEGFSSSLDHLRNLHQNAATLIQNLENKYKQETNIANLKVKFNNVWGYFIEVTASHTHKVPPHFVLKQTLTSGHRYMSEDLSKLQEEILKAQTQMQEEEMRLFNHLLEHILRALPFLQELSFDIASIDVACSIAFMALEKNYTRPVVDDSNTFHIQNGRHPCLDGNFIPNSCHLNTSVILSEAQRAKLKDPENISTGSLDSSSLRASSLGMTTGSNGMHIITGPNMGGKSTYLRQNALTAIMAQAGFFVPCEKAHIGIIDKVMTRIGASDDISKGRSTFMVEMIETSSILHMATEKSLVILDEIGRGTSTSDGLAIAFSVCDYLLNVNKSKVLFATHYHELSSLNHPNVAFFHVAIQEWNESIVFLHKIEEGFCDKSYGIHVAELAGFPKDAILKAKSFAA